MRRTGGYFHGPDDGETLIVRAKSAADNAVPSGNGAMAGVLTRLALATGDASYADRAEALIRAMSGDAERNYFSLATLLNGAELTFGATQIVIVGDRAAADTQALLAVVRSSAIPKRWLAVIKPGAELPAAHPAAGKGRTGGVATAYVCHGQTCSAPVTDTAALRALLTLRR